MTLQRLTGPIEFSIYLFALTATFVSAREAWLEAYAFTRGFSPLLVLLALTGGSKRRLDLRGAPTPNGPPSRSSTHATGVGNFYFVAVTSSAFGKALRGSISGRVAASYTTEAITAAACMRSPGMAWSYTSMLEWCVTVI